MRNVIAAVVLLLPIAAQAEVTCRETKPLSSIHPPQKEVAVRCYDDAKPEAKRWLEICTILYDEHGRVVDFDAPCRRVEH